MGNDKKFVFEPLSEIKRRVIVDTDIGPDCDDVGAVAVLCHYAKLYDIDIAGIIHCTSNPYGAGCIDAVCSYCGFENIAVGTFEKKGFLEDGQKYNKNIAAEFPNRFSGGAEVEDSRKVYRRLLAESDDNGVVLVTIGPLNTVYGLMKSEPDEISPLSGAELIKKKVYTVVSMAGIFPKGKEFNIICDIEAGKAVLEDIGVPVIYSGFEIGIEIRTGFPVEMDFDTSKNPIARSYRLYSETGVNASFDLTAVQFAFMGEKEFYSLSEAGRISVDAKTGENEFVYDENGTQYIMKVTVPYSEIADSLNGIIRGF